MKIFKSLSTAALAVFILQAHAQNEIPTGFKNGTIVLADSTVLSGYIKESIRSHASLLLLDKPGGKRKSYDGSQLISAIIDSTKYLCISGDFFKVICEGELSFLQKASDASAKPSYNGTEIVFNNGTEGRPGDYFIYAKQQNQLKLVTKKTFDYVIETSFTNCTAAIDKAKKNHSDIAQLKEAVEVYNNRNNNR